MIKVPVTRQAGNRSIASCQLPCYMRKRNVIHNARFDYMNNCAVSIQTNLRS